MKKTILSLVLLNFLVIVTYAQETLVNSADSIIFEKTIHDYGTIAQNSDGTYEFSFTNKGNHPIALTNVRASCGCTVAEWPKEPILPGKKGNIKVKYNTKIIGGFNKSITVQSNAANARVILRIKGSVEAN